TDVIEQLDVNASPLNTLAKRGVLEIYVENVERDPLKSAELPLLEDLRLTGEQNAALHAITTAVEKRDTYDSFLLHGVTGSGKTEVYIRAMQAALRMGRSAF